MIAGPSSSGKTTFSHRLSTQLATYGLKPHPIPVDDYFVNREDTPKDENGNYNPEIYKKVLEKLNVQPSETLVFEDSPVGIGAAVAANLSYVQITKDYFYGNTSKRS